MRQGLLAATLWLTAALPGVAEEPARGLDLSLAPAAPPAMAEVAPTLAVPARRAEPDPGGCLPGLPCGTQLRGTTRRRSVLELQVPAWRW